MKNCKIMKRLILICLIFLIGCKEDIRYIEKINIDTVTHIITRDSIVYKIDTVYQDSVVYEQDTLILTDTIYSSDLSIFGKWKVSGEQITDGKVIYRESGSIWSFTKDKLYWDDRGDDIIDWIYNVEYDSSGFYCMVTLNQDKRDFIWTFENNKKAHIYMPVSQTTYWNYYLERP